MDFITFDVYCKKELDYGQLVKMVETKFLLKKSSKPEVVFTFGGDGTFLDAIHVFGVKPIYIPINMGTLGFYTSWTSSDMDSIQEQLTSPNVIGLNTLDVTFSKRGIKCTEFCINEVTIINPINTQILDIFINDYLLERFRGTGICISTPTGSTAYNKSLGGAILSSDKRLFQLVNIAAIDNSKYRSIGNPIIFGDNEKLTLVTEKTNFENTIMTVDRKIYKLDEVDGVEVSLSSEKIRLMVRKDNNFYQRVRKSFIE